MPKKIATHVVSIDYDNCYGKIESPVLEPGKVQSLEALMRNNQYLIDTIKSGLCEGAEYKVFVGSNRQWLNVDRSNANQKNNGSCFLAIAAFAEVLGATFDPLLLSDIFLQEPAGFNIETFLNAVGEMRTSQPERYNGTHLIYPIKDDRLGVKNYDFMSLFHMPQTDSFFDYDKINIIYAQMHKIATENKSEDGILFDFIDDSEDILGTLADFFSKHTSLVPASVTLRLFNYVAGSTELSPCIEIQGTGTPDELYAETVRDMAVIAQKQWSRHYSPDLHLSMFVTPEALQLIRYPQAAEAVAPLAASAGRPFAGLKLFGAFKERPSFRGFAGLSEMQKELFWSFPRPPLLTASGAPSASAPSFT